MPKCINLINKFKMTYNNISNHVFNAISYDRPHLLDFKFKCGKD